MLHVEHTTVSQNLCKHRINTNEVYYHIGNDTNK